MHVARVVPRHSPSIKVSVSFYLANNLPFNKFQETSTRAGLMNTGPDLLFRQYVLDTEPDKDDSALNLSANREEPRTN